MYVQSVNGKYGIEREVIYIEINREEGIVIFFHFELRSRNTRVTMQGKWLDSSDELYYTDHHRWNVILRAKDK